MTTKTGCERALAKSVAESARRTEVREAVKLAMGNRSNAGRATLAMRGGELVYIRTGDLSAAQVVRLIEFANGL